LLGGAGRGSFDWDRQRPLPLAVCRGSARAGSAVSPNSNFTGSVAKGHGYFVWSKTPIGVQEVRILQGASPTVSASTPTSYNMSRCCSLITESLDLTPALFAGGEEKSYIASDTDEQGGHPSEVRHLRDGGVAPTVKKRPRVVTLLARSPANDFNH
jgi:hypothetical protein